jgi:putative ABC transport system permease protein
VQNLFGIPTLWLAIGLLVILLAFAAVLGNQARMRPILVKLGVRNVPRRVAQSVLITVGLMLSTTIIATSLGIGDTVTNSIRVDALTALGHTDEIITSPQAQLFGGVHLPDGAIEEIRQAAADNRIDGMMPVFHANLPTIDPRTTRTEAQMQVTGYDPSAEQGFGDLITAKPEWDGGSKAGTVVKISDLRLTNLEENARNDVFLNLDAARELAAKKGDRIIIITSTDSWQMNVLGIVENGGLAGGGGRNPIAIVRLDLAQAMMNQPGKYTQALISNRGGLEGGLDLSEEVTRDLRLRFSNREAAQEIYDILRDPKAMALYDFAIEGESASADLRDDILALTSELDRGTMSDEFVSLVADRQFASTLVTILSRGGLDVSAERLNTLNLQFFRLAVDDVKADRLELAEQTGSQFISLFSVFGSISIIVGLLLIFLVFVLLAAARSSEIGMARAVGMRQGHVVQIFTFEGVAYTTAAALLGTLMGVVASIILSQLLQSAVSAEQFTIHSTFTIRSGVIAFSSGMILTLITVMVSATWVSRLNIIVAIRGLRNDMAKRRNILTRMVQQGWPIMLLGALIIALGLVIDDIVITLGVGLSLFYIGFSVVIVGLGQLLRTVLGRSGEGRSNAGRIAGTLEGLFLLVFWSLPLDTYEVIVGNLKAGPEIFVLSGVAMVGSAVWLIMNNTSVIVSILYGILGRINSLRAVMKTAVAYPMGARFLTGLTVAMFAMIIFNLMIFAILNNLGNLAREDPTRVTGGYDISAIVSPEIPIDDFKGTLAVESEGSRTDIQVFAAQYVAARVHDAGASVVIPVEARQAGSQELEFKSLQLQAVDLTFLQANAWQVSHYDPTKLLDSGDISRDMWLALVSDPSLAIVNSTALPKDDSFSPNDPFDPNFGGFTVDGVTASGPRQIKPFEIEIRPVGGGEPIRRTVIAVLESLADELVIEQRSSADALTQARPSTLFTNAAVLSEISDVPVPFTTYHVRRSGRGEQNVTAEDVAARMETAFMDRSMVAVSTEREFELSLSQDDAFNQLFQGFMGIGLIVGVAAIGVLSFRAVEERRQSIGMLRALGFRSRMVIIQFLLEASFVTLIGTVLGLILGTLTSWNIFNELAKETDGLQFDIPWINVAIIVGVAWVFSVLMTVLPAFQAGRIYPAEALRYE